MLPDYYKILGVAATSTADEIHRAYLARAMENHPDRGGSHERMKLVIEAWEILSQPATRRRYDEARRGGESNANYKSAESDASRGEKATTYPNKWEDFAAAQYGMSKDGWWPTVSGSSSGRIFIAIGGGFGVIASYVLEQINHPKSAPLGQYILLALGGIWLGRWIHEAVALQFQKNANQSRKSAIIRCPSCGQKLRIPSSTPSTTVTCPLCKAAFPIPADMTTTYHGLGKTLRYIVYCHIGLSIFLTITVFKQPIVPVGHSVVETAGSQIGPLSAISLGWLVVTIAMLAHLASLYGLWVEQSWAVPTFTATCVIIYIALATLCPQAVRLPIMTFVAFICAR